MATYDVPGSDRSGGPVRSEDETDDPGEFDRLRRFILYHLGGFTLGLVRVNDPHQRDGVIASLADTLAAEGVRLIRIDAANRHPSDLRDAIFYESSVRAAVQDSQHTALAVVGLEHLIEAEASRTGRPPFAAALNLERDALPQIVPVPLVLFLADYAMDRLDLAAPDFFDWYSGIFRLRPPGAPPLEPAMPQMRHAAEPQSAYSTDLAPDALGARLELLEERRMELERAGPEARPRLAQVLKEIGDLYAALPEYDERQNAVLPLRCAAEILHEAGQKAEEAAALEQLGDVCYWIDDYPQATQRYEAALPIYREIGARLGEANCIKSLGDVHVQLAEYALARQRYEAALPIYREIGDRLGEANCIKSLGDVHVQLAEYALARGRYEAALPIYREIGARLGEANCISSLGDVHVRLAEYALARQRYEAALPIYREIGDRLGEANTITAFGDLALAEEDHTTAQEKFEQARSIYREIGERHWRTYIAPRLARALLALNEINTAQQALEEGAELARAIDGQPNLRSILWLLAQILEEKKDFAAALKYYDELLGLSPDNLDYLRRRANVLFQLKNYARALMDYQHLVKLNAQEAWAHNGIGNVRKEEEDFEGALAAYSRAIDADPNEAAFARNRASVLIAQGRLDEARADCETASRLAPDYPYTHGRWGDLYLACGQWTEAEAHYRAALAQDDSPGWRFGLAPALWGQTRLDDGWAEFDAALAKADSEARAEVKRDYQRLLERYPALPGLTRAIELLEPVQ
jgi:tetratricopeptide (TPR) repeat protein